jgi:hypothetical protein
MGCCLGKPFDPPELRRTMSTLNAPGGPIEQL